MCQDGRVQELREGLWTWTAPHPDWTPEEGGPDGWSRDVRSYACDTGDTLVLLDPLDPPSLVDELATGRHAAVVLTTPSHRRSADAVCSRLGAHVFESASGDLPAGLEARPSYSPGEALVWIPAHGALVAGDALLGEPRLRVPDPWLPDDERRREAREALRPLLALPIELLLPTHGDPITTGAREALAEALA